MEEVEQTLGSQLVVGSSEGQTKVEGGRVWQCLRIVRGEKGGWL